MIIWNIEAKIWDADMQMKINQGQNVSWQIVAACFSLVSSRIPQLVSSSLLQKTNFIKGKIEILANQCNDGQW